MCSFSDDALVMLCEYYPHKDLPAMVRNLVQRGADVHCKDKKYGKDALYCLAIRSFEKGEDIDMVDLFKFLVVEQRVDVNKERTANIDGSTLLHLICTERTEDPNLEKLVRILVEDGGALVDALDKAGKTDLDRLIERLNNSSDGSFKQDNVVQFLSSRSH